MAKSEKTLISKNLFLRIVSSAILIPFVTLIIFTGGMIFNAFILLIAILMAFEWSELTNPEKKLSDSPMKWKIFGIIYIFLPTFSLIWLRALENGERIVIWLFAVVCATDIFAYCFGKIIGGPKLAPSISPNKTWSGLCGGIFGATITGYLYCLITGTEHQLFLTIISSSLAIYAQIGDLIESWIKRKFKAKDSGNLIPGHGGLLDRVDGIVAATPKVVFIAMIIDSYGMF